MSVRERMLKMEAAIQLPGSGFGEYKENGGFSTRGRQNVMGACIVLCMIMYFDLWGYLPLPPTVRSRVRQFQHQHGVQKMASNTLRSIKAYSSIPNILGSANERARCPHNQHVGCLGDLLEKLCGRDKDASDVHHEYFKKSASESIWICCCPTPYAPCRLSERNKPCDDAVHSFVDTLEAPVTVSAAKEAVLAIRKTLLQSDEGCRKAFTGIDRVTEGAKAAICGTEMEPSVSRSIAHPGLFCEAITWQWEELGDGDEVEFGENACPIPTTPRIDVPARKDGALSPTELPKL